METKNRVANEIVMFFKTFMVSIPCGVLLFFFLYHLVWEINYYKNPEMDGVYDMNYDWQYKDYGYEIKAGAFGGVKNMIVYNRYFKYLPTTKEEMYSKVRRACNMYVEDKTHSAFLIALLTAIIMPAAFIILRILNRIINRSYQWIQKNKTI
jgi:hypothetical protein